MDKGYCLELKWKAGLDPRGDFLMWVGIWDLCPFRIPIGDRTSEKECIQVAGGSVSIAVVLQAFEKAPGAELNREKNYYTSNQVAYFKYRPAFKLGLSNGHDN